jgi:hypothetical protein
MLLKCISILTCALPFHFDCNFLQGFYCLFIIGNRFKSSEYSVVMKLHRWLWDVCYMLDVCICLYFLHLPPPTPSQGKPWKIKDSKRVNLILKIVIRIQPHNSDTAVSVVKDNLKGNLRRFALSCSALSLDQVCLASLSSAELQK